MFKEKNQNKVFFELVNLNCKISYILSNKDQVEVFVQCKIIRNFKIVTCVIYPVHILVNTIKLTHDTPLSFRQQTIPWKCNPF